MGHYASEMDGSPGPRPDQQPKQRRYILPWAAGCVTCSQRLPGEMMPPHDASDRCESGKRNHCSCDICF
jgi:hypothetical protein